MAQTLITKIDKRALSALSADAITELQRACVKFPFWPDRLTSPTRPPSFIERQLARARAANDSEGGSDASAYSVVCEELLEFFEAAERGDRAAAEKELVQVIAMLMRTHAHLGEYCARKQACSGQR